MIVKDKTQASASESRVGRPAFPMAQFRAEEGLSSIVHKLGHEISNYLTSIISFGAVISRAVETGQTPDKKNSYYIDSIVDEAWRIAVASERLVLLLSARTPHPVPCELRASLAKVLNKLKKHYPVQAASLSICYGRSSPVVMIEENQLQTLLTELLQNAFSAGESGSPVEVLMEDDPEVGEFTISNLAAPNPLPLDKLFEPFVTTRNSNRHIGLGLSVAWAIVERFNGTIQVAEEDEGGKCRFRVRVKLPTNVAATTAAHWSNKR